MVWCGACGHKLRVQYKGGTRYICNALHRSQNAPVCQHLPADPIDARVVAAFFEAVAPAELEAWEQTETARQLGGMRRSIPITAWSLLSWSTAGNWPCAICGKPKKPCPDAGMRWLSRPL